MWIPGTTFIAKVLARESKSRWKMEQAPKPVEAPKPKSKTMMIVAVIIIIILVAGVAAYYVFLQPGTSGTTVSMWENPIGSGCATSTECGYTASPLNVTVGTTVTWRNDGNQPHTATACHTANSPAGNACPTMNDPALPNFDVPAGSSFLNAGQTGSFRFDTVGTYYYYCQVHPLMHGIINVRTS
jgi:plastocyanin